MADIEDAVFHPPGRAKDVQRLRRVQSDVTGPQEASSFSSTAGRRRTCSFCPASGPKTASRKDATVNPIKTSAFELLKIGIGPSSSHTVGPMIACRNFVKHLLQDGHLERIERMQVELYGSLALTGIGHSTDKACIMGFAGTAPADVDPAGIEPFLAEVRESGRLTVGFSGDSCSSKEVEFDEERDIILTARELPLHPNGMACRAYAEGGELIRETNYYSVGGGFVLSEEEMTADQQVGNSSSSDADHKIPFPFRSMGDLLSLCKVHDLSIADVMRRNETSRREPEEVDACLEKIWEVMESCVDAGLEKEKGGEKLPGPLNVSRRAPDMYSHAVSERDSAEETGLPSVLMDEMRWVDCYALAAMEQNATMGRVVTAPTNGASGVVPAVLTYYMRHLREKQPEARRRVPGEFLLTAAAVGILAKENACISGAAGGCQAEVGTATAMAAAGLCAVVGGTPSQVEQAAEIALEHCLGMTCDPMLGLVQVPCIERNAMGANKAVNAVALVMKAPPGRRRAVVSYDDCLRVMKQTGDDMQSKYRETAQGGLAAEYDVWLQKQEGKKIREVEETMGLNRIRWGPGERATPSKAPARQASDGKTLPLEYSDLFELNQRVRAKTLDLSKC